MSLKQEKAYRLRWWTLIAISLSVIIVILDTSILNVALPTLQRELGITGSGLQWILNSYMMAFAALMLTTGALGDRIGRAKMLQAGIILFSLGSLAAAFASTSGQLIAWRVVMGVGGAMILPATLAIVTNIFPISFQMKRDLGQSVYGRVSTVLEWLWALSSVV